MSACLHLCFDEAHCGSISVKFLFGTFIKSSPLIPYFINIGQKYRQFYLKTNMKVLLLLAALNCHKNPLRMKLYQAGRIALEAEISREEATVLCCKFIPFVVHILY